MLAADGNAVVPRARPAEGDASEALRLVEERYFDLDAATAARDAVALLDAIERGAYGHVETEVLERIVLLVAEASLAIGDDDAVDAALDRLLAIDPEVVLDAARYAPPLRARFDERRAARVTVRASLGFDALPRDAAVFVDGRVVDASGAMLPIGRHLVRVESAGVDPFCLGIDLPREGTRVVYSRSTSPEAFDRVSDSFESPLDDDEARALAASGYSPHRLDLRRTGEGRLEARLVLPERARPFEAEVESGVPASRIAELLDAARRADRDAVAGRARRIHRRRLVLGSTAASVATALAVGLGVGLRPRDPRGWQGTGTLGSTP